MSSSKESPFSVTFKTDEGYAAGMVTVRGDNEAELEARLDGLTETLVQKVADVRSLILAANVVAGAPAAAPAAQGATVTQGQAAQGGNPDVKTCAHGVRVFKDGHSSKGYWSAWMCPRPKNASDKCDPIWNN